MKIVGLIFTFGLDYEQMPFSRQTHGGLSFFSLDSFLFAVFTKSWTMNHIATIRGNMFVLNFMALLILGVLYEAVYKLLWGVEIPEARPNVITLIVFLVGLVFVHEGIHGAAALLFVDRRKISFSAKWLVVTCKVDGMMTRGQYILYALAPAALLGLLGMVFYYVAGSAGMRFLAGLLFLGGVSGGGGDFWFVSQVLKYPKESLIIDRGIEIEVCSNNPTEDSGVVK